jgi:transcriptional regulator with XRE-family HTH domain
LNIIDQIRLERQRKELSQHDLASRAKLTQAQLSRLERGADIRLSTLLEIARALELDLRLIPRELISSVDYLISHRNRSETTEQELPPRFAGEEDAE